MRLWLLPPSLVTADLGVEVFLGDAAICRRYTCNANRIVPDHGSAHFSAVSPSISPAAKIHNDEVCQHASGSLYAEPFLMTRNRIICLCALFLLASVAASPTMADPAAPAQQSPCEVQANRFKAQHVHTEAFDYLNFGFFYFGKAVPPGPPSAYRDPESGTVFYVESDGRHVAAIDRNGKLLWVRNPFVEGGLCPYRSAHPYIYWIGPPQGADSEGQYRGTFDPPADAKVNAGLLKELDREIDWEIAHGQKAKRLTSGARFIGLSFNSSQFGYLNIATGDFYGGGQN